MRRGVLARTGAMLKICSVITLGVTLGVTRNIAYAICKQYQYIMSLVKSLLQSLNLMPGFNPNFELLSFCSGLTISAI